MIAKKFIFLLFFLTFAYPALAQEPASNQPNYDPNIPVQFGAGGEHFTVPLPPHLPMYLPNGAINLDAVWTQDGGARLYWNNVIIPKELKMAGNYWIDPALVPQLIPEKQAPVRRYWRKARRVKTKKVNIPPNVSSTALKAPAIPLPMTPVEEETKAVPPLKATSNNTSSTPISTIPTPPRADTEMPDVTPPPLQ